MHIRVRAHSLSRVQFFVILDCDPGARQAPLSMGLSRQEYWCGLPLPGTEPASPALVGKFFTAELSGEALSAGKETPKLRATPLEEEYHWRLTQQDLTLSGLTFHPNDTLKTQLGCPFLKEAFWTPSNEADSSPWGAQGPQPFLSQPPLRRGEFCVSRNEPVTSDFPSTHSLALCLHVEGPRGSAPLAGSGGLAERFLFSW